MWTCEQCGSNLLDQTAACPVCKLPADLDPNRPRPAEHKETSTTSMTMVVVVVGIALFVWRENHQQNRYDSMSADFSRQIGALNSKLDDLATRISNSKSPNVSTRTE